MELGTNGYGARMWGHTCSRGVMTLLVIPALPNDLTAQKRASPEANMKAGRRTPAGSN